MKLVPEKGQILVLSLVLIPIIFLKEGHGSTFLGFLFDCLEVMEFLRCVVGVLGVYGRFGSVTVAKELIKV